MSHYTSANDDAFVNRITFDFIAQVANRLETSQTKQNELAEKLRVSEGAVSQVLNLGRMNLTLKTMVRYARALGMKVAVVAYDDDDPQNKNGPVGSEIFSLSWEKIGKPRDSRSVSINLHSVARTSVMAGFALGVCWKGYVNSTLPILQRTNTADVVPIPYPVIEISKNEGVG